MKSISTAELELQSAIELPDRELLGGIIDIDGPINLFVLTGLLNGSFNNWNISALNGNSVTVTVSDNVSQNDLDTFCNQVIVVLAAQCKASLVAPPNPPDP